MKSLLTISLIVTLALNTTTYGQDHRLKVTDIQQNALTFSWENAPEGDIILKYGLTPDFELGITNKLELTGLNDATFYYVQAQSVSRSNYQETAVQLFSTASRSAGDITVYFNQSVDNNASTLTDAIQVAAFEDTIVAYIDRAQNTLDMANYNTGSLAIVNAVNAAEGRGVIVRYIAADNTGTNNDELTNLSASIPMIQRPSDGEVMHNKFIIRDAADAAKAAVLTGSTNHTNNSCHNDFNNIVIVEDQSLALAYETEFEEMWGSTGNTPNLSNAKFGDDKTDNTPHNFSIGGVPVELYFSPSDGTTSKIETAVLSADTDMQFALLTYTNNDLGDAVETIHNAGVDVKGIIENSFYFGSEYSGLQSAGVDVYSHATTLWFLHHKYGIVDANNAGSDPLVITGSHNWTNSAEDDYDENTLIIHDAEIANMYYEEFMARYAEMAGTNVIDEIATTDLSFFPNPTAGPVTINLKQTHKDVTIAVTDIIGKVITTKRFGTTNTANIELNASPGIYLFEVYSKDEKLATLKITRT
jgi:phosphatidylserine/phosphatidylglycerophosphate/cardiolipin synthase-like enzyme